MTCLRSLLSTAPWSLLLTPLSAQFAESAQRIHADLRAGALGQQVGLQVVALGDVDGDAVGDFAAAAPDHEVNGIAEVGKIFVFSGASGGVLWTFEESGAGARLGTSLEAGDWNGDGVRDVIAGAPFIQHGRVWVLSGQSGAVITRLDPPPGALWFGYSLATGILDGSGRRSLIIAAPDTQTGLGQHTGKLLFYHLGINLPLYWNELEGPVRAGEFGIGLAVLGDLSVPPDGKDEFVAGTRLGRSQTTGVYWEGQARAYTLDYATGRYVLVYAVDGIGLGESRVNRFSSGGDLDFDGFPDFLATDSYFREVELLSGRDGARVRTITGFGANGEFDPRAALVDDLDGDGGADLAIGVPRDESGAFAGGRVYLCSGSSGSVLATITGTTSALQLGASVRPAGDFDGDGRPDLVVGALGSALRAQPEGRAYVLSAHLPAVPNLVLPAQSSADPALADAGGDPSAGPLLGSALEPFALALDCSAMGSGPWVVHGQLGSRASPYASPYGSIWLAGPRVFTFAGTHASAPVAVGPLVLPISPALVGLRITSQGLCGGGPTRTSAALVQTLR